MLDIAAFGAKLRNHRKNLSLTQEEVAVRMGISPQAISKWENGDCLPDCFNLKALADIYGLSLDILLETEGSNDIERVSARIEQMADEFIWEKSEREYPAHRDLGEDLWKMWKGIYFIEVGNKEHQQRDKERGNLRVCSEYGMKIWDDDGIACVVKSSLKSHLGNLQESNLTLLSQLCSPEGIRLITSLDPNQLVTKAELVERCGIELPMLNELLLLFLENEIIEYVSSRANEDGEGYKIHAYRGMAAYLVLGALFVLQKPYCMVSEYINRGSK